MTRTGSREGPGAGRAEGTPRDAPGLATHRGRIAWIGERDGWTHPWFTRVASHAARSRRGRRVIPPSAQSREYFAIPSRVRFHAAGFGAPLSFTPGARDEPASQARAQPRGRGAARAHRGRRGLQGDRAAGRQPGRGAPLPAPLSRAPPPPVPASPSPSPTASPARLEPPPATRRSRRRTERRR